MPDQYARTRLLIGAEGLARLRAARVAVFGIGGVGGYVVEALARSGVGTLDLVDDDRFCLSNLNRQLCALHSTLGRDKVEVAAARVADIDPTIVVNRHKVFYMPDTADQFDFTAYSYVVDAIDTVKGKLTLAEAARAAGVPIISCMGAGNKLDPSAFRVADIYETRVCPLARVMRAECRKRGIDRLKVVYSEEKPVCPPQGGCTDDCPSDTAGRGAARRAVPGSTAFAPAAAGLIAASVVVRELCGLE